MHPEMVEGYTAFGKGVTEIPFFETVNTFPLKNDPKNFAPCFLVGAS